MANLNTYVSLSCNTYVVISVPLMLHAFVIPREAGDFVKFGLPMASSVTMLARGLVEYRDAYELAGELQNGLDCIKWPLDYFIKAHVADNKFYGQVGRQEAVRVESGQTPP